MKPVIRFAVATDIDICLQYDHCKDRGLLLRKIEAGELIIAELDGKPVGYLTIQFIWEVLPYISLVRVAEPFQRQGIGRRMLAFLEQHLREQGHKQLLSSSQVDEPEPQAWHRARGFRECGILAGVNEGAIGEVFFRKKL